MFDSILEWVVIGLVLVNLIALVNWHRVMHYHIKQMGKSVNNLNKLFLVHQFGIVFVEDSDTIENVNKAAEIMNDMSVDEWDNS